MRVQLHSKCSLWWCDRPYYAKGYCVTHYRAVARYGSPYGKHKEDMKRFDDIISRACELAQTVGYPPGSTRDQMLSNLAKKILDIIGK